MTKNNYGFLHCLIVELFSCDCLVYAERSDGVLTFGFENETCRSTIGRALLWEVNPLAGPVALKEVIAELILMMEFWWIESYVFRSITL